MLRIIQIVVIGTICSLVFALLYGNSSLVTVLFFGNSVATGSLGSFLLLAFFSGLLITGLGALFFGIKHSLQMKKISGRERRMHKGWAAFSDAQLSALLGDASLAQTQYKELLLAVPEATAAYAPLAAYDNIQAREHLPEGNSALLNYLKGQQAERQQSFVRATERYQAAFEAAKIPTLLRLARDSAIKADQFDIATSIHQKLNTVTKLSDDDVQVEATLAARELSVLSAEARAAKVRDLVKRYPSSIVLVTELAELENSNNKPEQAALLIGRVLRLNPSEELVARFENSLKKLPMERALSILELATKGLSAQIVTPIKLATLINQRAISAAQDVWNSASDRSSPRMLKLGAALAMLTDRKDLAIDSLSAATSAESSAVLNYDAELALRKTVGLAPQYSTP